MWRTATPAAALARIAGGVRRELAELADRLGVAGDSATPTTAAGTEVVEVHLVVLDAADRERQVLAQRPVVRVDLVRGALIGGLELLDDLVVLVAVGLVQAPVRLDRLRGDPVELEDLLGLGHGRDLVQFRHRFGSFVRFFRSSRQP